jgi:hypothetical protein
VRFSVAMTAAVAGLAQAAALPAKTSEDFMVQKRGVIVTLLTAVVENAIGVVVSKAIDAGTAAITHISDS